LKKPFGQTKRLFYCIFLIGILVQKSFNNSSIKDVQIDVSSLPKGFYQVAIKTDDKVDRRKLLIQ